MTGQNRPHQFGIETGQSWVVASTALLVLSITYGAPLVTVVALQPIATDFGTQRAGPALAVSLTYVGSGSVACRVVRHALDRHRVRTDDRARSCSCL